MHPPKRAFLNARLATPFRLLDGYLVAEGGVIAAVGAGEPTPELLDGAETIDVAGRLLAPGFIDGHVHGGGGADVMDATPEALAAVAAAHAAGGTTAFLPTTTCASREQLEAVFAAHRRFVMEHGAASGARSLGLHLEGPYLSPAQAGALDPAAMRAPTDDEVDALLAPENAVRRMTVAPELPGGMALGQRLRAAGCLASIGHSTLPARRLPEALEHGYELLTHFYSGMQGVTREHAYRVAGLVEGGYLHDQVSVEVIADGAHLPPELLRLIRGVKGASRMVLTTDAMRAAGLGPGEYDLGGGGAARAVIVEDGVAKLPDRSAFAGSVALADRLLATMVRAADSPLLEALQMLTVTPARLLGVDDRKGRLATGADADLVVLGDDLSAWLTVVGGRLVHGRHEGRSDDAVVA